MDKINTSKEPAPIPPLLSGNVIFKKVWIGLAPRFNEAEIRLLSIFLITLYIGNIINGKRIYTIPMVTPIRLYINEIGCFSIPICSRKLLINPVLCNRIIHAYVLTRRFVQKGINIKMNKMLALFSGNLAKRYATGNPITRHIAVTIMLNLMVFKITLIYNGVEIIRT
jgi:hypothetical protein